MVDYARLTIPTPSESDWYPAVNDLDERPDAQPPHLETFSRAAELGSFTGATNALGLTQAAVSQRAHDLDQALGVPVFHRRNGRSDTTYACRIRGHWGSEGGMVRLEIGPSSLLPVRVQRMPDLADAERDGVAASGMRPLRVAQPFREGRDIGERRLPARLAASPAFPSVDAEPDQPGDTIRVQVSGDHEFSPTTVLLDVIADGSLTLVK